MGQARRRAAEITKLKAQTAQIPETAWHYTGRYGHDILRSSVILLEQDIESLVAELEARWRAAHGKSVRDLEDAIQGTRKEAEGCVRVAWFSTNQFWENSAGAIPANPKMPQGCMRISVPTASLEKWVGSDISSPERKQNLIEAGINRGANPEEWYFSRVEVPSTQWTHVQYFDGVWLELCGEELRKAIERLKSTRPTN